MRPDSDGQVSKPAVLIKHDAPKDSNVVVDTWRFNTLPGSFKIALLGTTKSGGSFVMYSAEKAQSGPLSDKAKGVVVWKKIFTQYGPSLNESQKKSVLDRAFPQGR